MNNNLSLQENGKFLPIGTVVLLEGGKKKVMITGFLISAEGDTSKIYDYSGCLYPEGIINTNQTAVFNHNQIKEIFYLGYKNEEEQEFINTLNNVINMANVISQNNGSNNIPNSNINTNNFSQETTITGMNNTSSPVSPAPSAPIGNNFFNNNINNNNNQFF